MTSSVLTVDKPFSIQKEDIANFFFSLKEGKKLTLSWKQTQLSGLSKEHWREQIQKHQEEISSIYHTNVQLTERVFEPILKNPKQLLTDELYDTLLYYLKDMYQNNYDDPFILWQLGNLLIPHYKEKQLLDQLIFCYQVAGYGGLEISRMGDHKIGRESVKKYKEILKYKYRLDEFKQPESVVAIFVAYSNLIRVEQTLGNLSHQELYRIWLDFNKYRSTEYSHKYDEQIPRIPALCSFTDTDFRTYCLSSYLESILNKDLSFRSNYNRSYLKRLITINRNYLESIVLSSPESYKTSPDIFCNYQLLLGHTGEISWDEACNRMIAFHKENLRKFDAQSTDSQDPFAIAINPLNRMIYALSLSSFSAEEKSDKATRFCEEIIRFSKKYAATEESYAINNGMAMYCFNNRLLRCIQSDIVKENLITRFVLTRHPSTYMHSTMVEKAALLILESIFQYCPETLIGILNTKNVSQIRAKHNIIRAFVSKAALYHDIGKNSLIDIVTSEHRKICDFEFSVIKKHPDEGAKYLSGDPVFSPYASIARGHHKFYNGKSGYPEAFDNTKSKDKPLIDLITICDCLDAATDYFSRNYHQTKTLDQVIAEFQAGSGVRYNPAYVNLITEDLPLRAKLKNLITRERKEIYYQIYRQFMET